ncbi:MAG: hypothetical protein Q8P89_00375 [bacterium]|nr:hypothetical protein [bacterium]
MLEDIRTHSIHYFVLLLILGSGLFGFIQFSYNPDLRRAIILAVAALYIVWGLLHHFLEGNLNLKIMIEYTSVAALALTLTLIMTGVAS